MIFLKNIFGHSPLERRRAYWGIALVAPNVLGLFFFFGIPVLSAFATSLQKWNAVNPPTFFGLGNFQRLFADPVFWQAFGNSVKLLLLTVPTGAILSFGVAFFLNQRFPARSVLRTVYFLPVITSTVAASIVWAWIFQPRYGLLGNLFAGFGLRDVAWLTRPDLILIPIAVVTVWQRLGFDMILFLAGLQNISPSLYEAAIIDGARRRDLVRYITIPLLSPTTFLVLILSLINSFQIFDQVFIMTSRTTPGGIDNSAVTLSYFLYRSGFGNSEFGYASAIALVMFVITLAFTIAQLRLQPRWVYYESDN